jgi:hypothetical protein
VQRFCTAGTTGKKNEITASPIASATATVSFLANEVTMVDWRAVAWSKLTGNRHTKDSLDDMRIHQPGEFEHIDFLFAVKDGFKSCIRLNEFFFLKVVLFNVFPKLLSQFGPGNGIFANNLGKRGIRLDRLHERAFGFTFV